MITKLTDDEIIKKLRDIKEQGESLSLSYRNKEILLKRSSKISFTEIKKLQSEMSYIKKMHKKITKDFLELENRLL